MLYPQNKKYHLNFFHKQQAKTVEIHINTTECFLAKQHVTNLLFDIFCDRYIQVTSSSQVNLLL